MLTPFDDFAIHQTSLPVAHPASGDPNHYDRFFFNGYREDLYFGAAMGLYPNRGVIDAAFSVVDQGVQRSVFASGRIPADRTRTRIGPMSIEVLEPLRSARIRVDAGDLGLDADVVFRARSVALEEPRQVIQRGARLVMDYTRLAQWGTWTGSIEAGGHRVQLEERPTFGCKDRSWGVRPVGAPAPSAPDTELPQLFFLWAPLNFADRCTHLMVFEHADGHRWFESGAVLPVLAPNAPPWGTEDTVELAGGDFDVDWEPGLRRARGAAITLRPRGGAPQRIVLEPVLTFRMRGLGYTHPTRGHGLWQGELDVVAEEHRVEELEGLDPSSVHVEQVVRAMWGDREGIGVLEQLALGPHEPSGFREFLDGAPG